MSNIEKYQQAAEIIKQNQPCVAVTGAGISAPSGIATYRTAGGLWEKYDPTVYASIEVFGRDPSKYWSVRRDFIVGYDQYQPNAAHLALVELEKMELLQGVITQNVDGLHKKAGNQTLVELHGSLREIYCRGCKKEYIAPNIPDGIPPYCDCGGVLKPNTVLFGESLPAQAIVQAESLARSCKSMLVIGTSANVYPAASLPNAAKHCHAKLIEINPEPAFSYIPMQIAVGAEIALPEIVKNLKNN